MDTTQAKIYAHPIRQKILAELADGERSPQMIATATGEHLHNVSYHMKRLQQLGAVELVKERQVRGAVEHFYGRKDGRLSDTEALDRIAALIDPSRLDADEDIAEIIRETGREV